MKSPIIHTKAPLPTDQSPQSREMGKPGEELITQHRTGDGKKGPALPPLHNLSQCWMGLRWPTIKYNNAIILYHYFISPVSAPWVPVSIATSAQPPQVLSARQQNGGTREIVFPQLVTQIRVFIHVCWPLTNKLWNSSKNVIPASYTNCGSHVRALTLELGTQENCCLVWKEETDKKRA